MLASAISRSAQQVSARPGITAREELRGKRWGIVVRNDADECAIAMAFERWGWDRHKGCRDRRRRQRGARLDLLLDRARVDVAIMHAPETFQAPKRGYHIVEDFGRLDVVVPEQLRRHHARLDAATARHRSALCAAFCRGLYRFRSDAAFGIAVLRKYTGETDIEVLGRPGCCSPA